MKDIRQIKDLRPGDMATFSMVGDGHPYTVIGEVWDFGNGTLMIGTIAVRSTSFQAQGYDGRVFVSAERPESPLPVADGSVILVTSARGERILHNEEPPVAMLTVNGFWMTPSRPFSGYHSHGPDQIDEWLPAKVVAAE